MITSKNVITGKYGNFGFLYDNSDLKFNYPVIVKLKNHYAGTLI